MDWKKWMNKLLSPPAIAVIIMTFVCTVALVHTLAHGHETHPLAYVTYVFSFYVLCVIVYGLIKVVPGYYKNTKNKVYSHPVGEKFMTDASFRTHVGVNASLYVNFLYALVNAFAGIWYSSWWAMSLAVYYIILTVLRYLLAHYMKNEDIYISSIKGYKLANLCAGILMTINFALSGVVVLIILKKEGFSYGEIFIYVMALYTFYITILAIVNLIKYRKYKNPILSMAKIVNMAAALVSMLSLETAMLTQFGKDMSETTKTIFIAATGAGVSIIVITMAIYSIVHNKKSLKALRKEQTNE
ncbi:MAG: hypothetical protein E7252_08305 [Lachnospira sp.]|nr:hypothetical protein [Lachnospira sp.]